MESLNKEMFKGKKIASIIVAAGAGTRLGGQVPKQFLEIMGVPMVFHSVRTFASCPLIDQVVVVTRSEAIEFCAEGLGQISNLTIVSGGKTRPESVYAGLLATDDDIDYVLVHDGARPYVKEDLIHGVVAKLESSKAVIPTVPPKDTIRQGPNTLDRSQLQCVQTPQGFDRQLLVKAYEDGFKEGFEGTDDSSYVERLGINVAMVQGDHENIKITTVEDLPMVQTVGIGYDVHRVGGDKPFVLGGIHIPWDKSLLAHSDGDVLIHAVMDAMLGAASMGDIGDHFPDTDKEYENASGERLLTRVNQMIRDKGYSINNIDVTVIAQAPKIGPYKKQISQNLGRILNISPEYINIKGTTTEKLGFVGRVEGIATEAVCILTR